MTIAEKLLLSRRAGADAEDAALGARLRTMRKARGRRLKQIADEAGLSVSLLSQIERGISSPSMRVLRQICHALQIDGAALFEDSNAALPAAASNAENADIKAIEHGDPLGRMRPATRLADAGVAGATTSMPWPEEPGAAFVVRAIDRRPLRVNDVTKYRVTPADCATMEAFLMEIGAGAQSDTDFAWQTGDKIAYIVGGKLKLFVDDVALLLETGDVYGFSSGHRYRWENAWQQTTTLLVVNGNHFYV
jgi:transcriptional regulator with XRE-family HTH domain